MNDKVFRLKPWTPEVQKTAERLIARIHELTPELEVLFMGAAALELPGKNDIDLDILCNAADIKAYTNKLALVLGQPKKSKPNITAWEFQIDGFEIDCMLSDPSISHVPLQRMRYEKLKTNPALLDEYRKLKEACDGLAYEEYEKKKATFLKERVFAK